MSLVLRQAGLLKPEIRLAQAVSEFEAILAPEQKSSFQASRARAVSTPPTMSDVMRLTAEIDHGQRRCFGPRMTNTLQAIQQFAALGDIVVGGGQNLIACGVWAAARMTLHVTAGYFTYLENLSLLLMTIGRNAPRYQTMAALYPKSKRLQGYLCEYFIVITNLCHHSIKWTKRSALSRLSSALNDPQMKSFKDDLDLWSSNIREEANLLLSQTVTEESRRNSLFRSLVTSQSAHQRKIERQTWCLDTCSQYDYRRAWKQMRKCGSTRSLTTFEPYQEWKDEGNSADRFKKSSILFLGKLGSGKSVLLANIVDDLNLQDRAITLYFFARRDSEESMKARTIFGCLIRQLLEHSMSKSAFGHLLQKTRSHLDLGELVDLFKKVRPQDITTSIVLDGLDECEPQVQRTVLKHLRQLWTSGYKVCLSVRTPEQTVIWDPRLFAFRVSIPESNPDITEFVEAEVTERVESGRLVIGDPALVEVIKQELITRSCGMFLWTSLQLDAICSEVSDHDIRHAIRDLPKDLTQTFQKNLAEASADDHKGYHVRLFKILVGAKELLTTEQLRQAASVSIGQTIWNAEKEINSIDTVLKFCGSLVMVDEEDESVRFIHHSARSFCIKRSHRAISWAFSEGEAHQHISEVLVTFLSYNVFVTEVSRNVMPKIDVKEIPKRVAWNAIGPYQIGRNIAEKAFRSTSLLKQDIGPTLVNAATACSNSGDNFPLLTYAKANWIKHTSRVQEVQLPQWYALLDHPSFGIDRGHFPVPMPVSEPPRTHTDSWPFLIRDPDTNKLIPSTRPSLVAMAMPSASLDMRWALSNGHILLLNHELTRARGTERIRNYVILWGLLRRLALHTPSRIMHDLNYDLVRWLSPMFLDVLRDHPAKVFFLQRISTSDESYIALASKAVKHLDLFAVFALCRNDYEYSSDFSMVEWPSYTDQKTQAYDSLDNPLPLILKAALSNPPQTGTIQTITQCDNLWLFDLANWSFRMGQEEFLQRLGQAKRLGHAHELSLVESFKSPEWIKISRGKGEGLRKLLEVIHKHFWPEESDSIVCEDGLRGFWNSRWCSMSTFRMRLSTRLEMGKNPEGWTEIPKSYR